MRDRESTGRFLVLGTVRRGEGDLEVEAVTESDARIRLSLRSARKGSPFSGRLQPLARLDGRWARGLRGRWRLTEARGEDLRLAARRDLGRTAGLAALGEAAARALPQGASAEGLYALLDSAAAEIADGEAPGSAFRLRFLDLLTLLGHAPDAARLRKAATPRDFDAFLHGWFEHHLEFRLASRALLRAAGYDASA